MRILEVARQFSPKIGGIESCVLNLSHGLVARGHAVEVVTLDRDLRTGRLLVAPPEIDSIPVHRISYFGSARYPIAPSWLGLIDKFDLIHVHGIDFFVDSAAASRFIGLHRKPIVVTTHGGIFHTKEWRRLKDFYWHNLLRRSLEAADAVVAVSERDAELFSTIVPASRILIIPNGIDPSFTRARAPRVRGRVVTFGRMTKAKAIDRIIQLLAKLSVEFERLELVIAGPDENGVAETLRVQSAILGVENKVRIVGALPLERLAALVASAQVFVSASDHEGFGIASVEALSAGVPVLVTRTGIHEDVVQAQVNGWFWSGHPDEDAASTLRQALLLSDARLDNMSDAARASAAPFAWKIATEKYANLFEGLDRKDSG